jgi:PAS domain S-box-containing protein
MSNNTSDSSCIDALEVALRACEARFTALTESLPFFLWMIDESGRYVLQNSAVRRHYGDILGKRPEEVAQDAESLALWQDNNRRAFNGETVRAEVEFKVGGQPRYFFNVITPVISEGRCLGILGVNLDITDRKRAEEEARRRNAELQEANQELERLGRSKDQLIAMISHELRTPLVTGLGYIEMLLDGKLGPIAEAVRSRLAIAHRNLRRLADLIGGVLRYQRLAATGFDPASLQATSFDVTSVAHELVDGLAVRDADRVAVHYEPDLPEVFGDRELIHMALSNLLENALNHAGERAAVRVTMRPRQGGVEVRVEDDGVGIPPHIIDTAEEPFIRGEETQGGAGLGLAIVRAIVQAHGSEMRLESAPGAGTRVAFHLQTSPSS